MTRGTSRSIVIAALGALLAGCGTPLHSEMLGESIKLFASKMKMNNEKLWITGPADNTCDNGCQSLCSSLLVVANVGGGGKDKGGGGLTGGLFGGGGSKDGSSPHDRLAYEVFANYFTQNKSMRVVEVHRHNYSTELGTETRKKQEVVGENGKVIATGMSCEDLCILDEAKKRRADKVLTYHILEMSNEEMKIHIRLSDVPTGIVDASQTIKVMGLRAFDASPPRLAGGRRGAAPAAPPPGVEE